MIENRYLLPFLLVTSLFALWGFANDITNPMVAAFQTVMELSAGKAALIQFAFYGGYTTMAVPAALFVQRYSYRAGILLGLLLYAIGAFLFIPAAAYQLLLLLALHPNVWFGLLGDHCQSPHPVVGKQGDLHQTLEPCPSLQPSG